MAEGTYKLTKHRTAIVSKPIDVVADATDIRTLGKNLRKGKPEVYRALRFELETIGEIVADRAIIISRRSSDRIWKTIRVRTTAGLNAFVEAGGDEAPHAAAFEGTGGRGKFRHPVYGNTRRWVSQETHPYLAPAFRATGPEVQRLLDEAVERGMRRAGFR